MQYLDLNLYYTEACHLCELAKKVYERVAEKQMATDQVQWRLLLVDVANSEELFERYGVRIPVVKVANQEEELGWPFDEFALDAYLTSVVAKCDK